MSDGLIAFLRTRLREDEATARAVAWDGSGNSLSWGLAASATVEVGNDEFNTDDRTVANHIVNNDPARVMREVEAKRWILDRYEELLAEKRKGLMIGDLIDEYQDVVLPLFAATYANHPDFREEWAAKVR